MVKCCVVISLYYKQKPLVIIGFADYTAFVLIFKFINYD